MLKLQYVRWRRPSWMEVRVTGHNFENWPLKDHSCHVCFKLAYWFQRRRFLNIFPIGSYVRWWWPSWMEVGVTGHNFEIWPPKDHSCHVCFKLGDWFQKRRLLHNVPLGSYVHWRRPFWTEIGITEHNLEVDHLRTIDDMFAISAYWFQRRRF